MNGAVLLETFPGDYYGTGVRYWADNTVLYEHEWSHMPEGEKQLIK